MIWRTIVVGLLAGLASGSVLGDEFLINEGISGSWFNQEQSGQGFLVEVIPGENPQAVLSWYTYEDAGGTQAWLIGAGPLTSQDTVEVELFKPVGGVFDDPAEVERVFWGTATVSFSSCRDGVVAYDSPANGLSGSIEIVRIADSSHCERMSAGESQLYTAAGESILESNETGIATLLKLPPGEGPFPAMVVVHGSGAVTRTGLQFLADLAVQRGYAAMTYDKRGVGQSGGIFFEVGPGNLRLFQLADDIEAMVQFLRHHKAIDADRVGLLGVSQGGWINALAGSELGDLAFMVSVVGPAVSVGEEIFYSDLTGSGMSVAEANDRVADFTGAHGYDPIPDLQTIEFPALWVLGGMDRSIPTEVTVRRLENLIGAGSPFEIHLYPDANHGMRNPSGASIPYMTQADGVFDWLEGVLND